MRCSMQILFIPLSFFLIYVCLFWRCRGNAPEKYWHNCKKINEQKIEHVNVDYCTYQCVYSKIAKRSILILEIIISSPLFMHACYTLKKSCNFNYNNILILQHIFKLKYGHFGGHVCRHIEYYAFQSTGTQMKNFCTTF